MNKQHLSTSPDETKEIAAEFGSNLSRGTIVCLYGDLGFGKTTFAQGLAEGLGIKKRIISPTFVIVRQYNYPSSEAKRSREVQSKGSRQARTVNLYHIDLYRTSLGSELEGLGLEEILTDQDSIKVIEWPEKLGKLLPRNRINIHFEYVDENRRKITIDYGK